MIRTRPSCVLVTALAAVALGCGGEAPTAPVAEPRVVVHAVLDPQNAEQVILVERTRDGTRAPLPPTPGGALDPIVSAGGMPLSGARVVIFGPGSDSIVAVEDASRRLDGVGAGVYRVPSATVASASASASASTLRLVPGTRYRLRVDTPLGSVRGATRMPRFNLAVDRTLRPFNLDTDSLWRPRVPGDGARPAGYLLRVQVSGGAPLERLVSDDNPLLLAPAPINDDRSWSFGYARPYIRPGVAQRFIVVAVDSNFYEYTMGAYDPFGHDARGNRLDGGVGLFGAVATIVDANLDLTATRDHAIEGDWAPMGSGTALPVALRLYESPRFPGPPAPAGPRFWGTALMPGGDTLLAAATLTGQALRLELTLPGSSQVRQIAGTFDGTGLTLDVPGSGGRVRYASVTPRR